MSSPGFLRAVRRSILALVIAGGAMTVTPVRAALSTSGVSAGFEQDVEVGLEAGVTIGATLDDPAADGGGAIDGDIVGASLVGGEVEGDLAGDVAGDGFAGAAVEGVAHGTAGAEAVALVEGVAGGGTVGDLVQAAPQDPGLVPIGDPDDLVGGLFDEDGEDADPILTPPSGVRLPAIELPPPVGGGDHAAPVFKPTTKPSVLSQGLNQPVTGRVGVAPRGSVPGPATPALTRPAQPVEPLSLAPTSRTPLPRTGPGTLVQGPFALALLSAGMAVRAAVRRRPRSG